MTNELDKALRSLQKKGMILRVGDNHITSESLTSKRKKIKDTLKPQGWMLNGKFIEK
jgi:hypothetical protein